MDQGDRNLPSEVDSGHVMMFLLVLIFSYSFVVAGGDVGVDDVAGVYSVAKLRLE